MTWEMTTDTRRLRDAFGKFATGVAIVTAADGEGGFVGVTVNSFTSVSLDPPLVLWCIDRSAWSLPAFLECGHYAVNLLSTDQRDLSDRFARRGKDKFAGIEVEEGIGGTALLPRCTMRLQCRIVDIHNAGDHLILVGEVLAFEHADPAPLVFWDGQYRELREMKG